MQKLLNLLYCTGLIFVSSSCFLFYPLRNRKPWPKRQSAHPKAPHQGVFARAAAHRHRRIADRNREASRATSQPSPPLPGQALFSPASPTARSAYSPGQSLYPSTFTYSSTGLLRGLRTCPSHQRRPHLNPVDTFPGGCLSPTTGFGTRAECMSARRPAAFRSSPPSATTP